MGWVSNRGRWKINVLRLWNRLTVMDSERLLKKIFLWDKEQHASNNKTNFCAQAKQILIAIGKRESYYKSEPIDIESAKNTIVSLEKSQWIDNIKDKPKLDFLVQIKSAFGVERYITINMPRYERSLLSQLRYGILQIQLETGRYKGDDRAKRLCKICNRGVIEDQYHFVFECPAYSIRRGMFIERVKDNIANWDSLSNTEKFIELFQNHPRTLGKFVKDIFVYRKSTLYK